MRIAVCEDDDLERKIILSGIREVWGEESITACFGEGEAVIQAAENGERFDLYFFDVYLPGMLGIEAAEEIKKIDTDYVLVCGDFNDTPISYAHRTIQGPLKDAYAASGRGVGVTYNENFFWFRIDNILHSANMKPINCTVDKVRYSDHYPLWCYLQLKEND